jgi:hypothetical protein
MLVMVSATITSKSHDYHVPPVTSSMQACECMSVSNIMPRLFMQSRRPDDRSCVLLAGAGALSLRGGVQNWQLAQSRACA